MHWSRAARGLGDEGVAALLASAQAEIGGAPLSGIRFVVDSRQMLAAARQIERLVRDRPTTLLVGFQRGANLEYERDRYERLAAGRLAVVAFGVGAPRVPVAGVRWVDVPLDRDELVNQWFLVARMPRPIALVGFETSPAVQFGQGGAGDPRRSWAGFASDDARLVDLLIEYLDEVRKAHPQARG